MVFEDFFELKSIKSYRNANCHSWQGKCFENCYSRSWWRLDSSMQ